MYSSFLILTGTTGKSLYHLLYHTSTIKPFHLAENSHLFFHTSGKHSLSDGTACPVPIFLEEKLYCSIWQKILTVFSIQMESAPSLKSYPQTLVTSPTPSPQSYSQTLVLLLVPSPTPRHQSYSQSLVILLDTSPTPSLQSYSKISKYCQQGFYTNVCVQVCQTCGHETSSKDARRNRIKVITIL